MSAVNTIALGFESAPALEAAMRRVGAEMPAADFVSALVEAWRIVQPVAAEEVERRFRAGRACEDFRALLRLAAAPGSRVLAIGCGEGLGGRSSAYAASIVREVVNGAEVDQLDLRFGGPAAPCGACDLVVTHSLLHFLHDFTPVCRLIMESLSPGGAYVMANEPNARFWQNRECEIAMRRADATEARRRRLARFFSPSSYRVRVGRILERRGSRRPIDDINRVLRERFGFTADLGAKEIVRIIDPHVRDDYPGTTEIGLDGISWKLLETGPLAGLQLETVRTSGYVMRENPAALPQRWAAEDRRLASAYPLDGYSFSALWRKRGAGAPLR